MFKGLTNITKQICCRGKEKMKEILHFFCLLSNRDLLHNLPTKLWTKFPPILTDHLYMPLAPKCHLCNKSDLSLGFEEYLRTGLVKNPFFTLPVITLCISHKAVYWWLAMLSALCHPRPGYQILEAWTSALTLRFWWSCSIYSYISGV